MLGWAHAAPFLRGARTAPKAMGFAAAQPILQETQETAQFIRSAMNSETPNDLKVLERQVTQSANSLLVSPIFFVAMFLLFSADRPLFAACGTFAFGIGITLKIAQRRFRTDLGSAMSLIKMTLYLHLAIAVFVCTICIGLSQSLRLRSASCSWRWAC
jgi:hypothetical protein